MCLAIVKLYLTYSIRIDLTCPKQERKGEKIERFWKKACSRRRLRWSYRLRGQRPLALYQRGSRGERTQGPATKPEEKKKPAPAFFNHISTLPFSISPHSACICKHISTPLSTLPYCKGSIKHQEWERRTTHARSSTQIPSLLLFPVFHFQIFHLILEVIDSFKKIFFCFLHHWGKSYARSEEM